MTLPAKLVAAAAACCAFTNPVASQAPRAHVAFVDVHVVPLDSARVLRNQTVVVRDGIVTALGPSASMSVPSGATVVAGQGRRFLTPGLVDFHSHSVDAVEMPEYLRAGVTTIVHMGHATPAEIAAHRRAESEGSAVPRVYFGKRLNQPYGGAWGVATAEQGAEAVRSAKGEGVDFIKVYSYLAPETFFAITQESKRAGLPVFGHVVRRTGLETTLDSGVTVLAHLEELVYELGPTLDRSRIPALAAMLKRKGVRVVTTLVALEEVARQWGRRQVIRDYLAQADTIPLGPRWRPVWEQGEIARLSLLRADTAAMMFQAAKDIALALQREGVPLLAGTDAPGVAGVFAGVALRQEFRNLLASGLTPFEVLQSATTRASATLGEMIASAPRAAAIAVGRPADLLLVAADPLNDPLAVTRPEGMLVGGRWFTSATLPALPRSTTATVARAVAADVASPDAIVTALYDVISGPIGKRRDWNRFRSLFVPGAKLLQIRVSPDSSADIRAYSPDEYATLATRFEETGFFEREVFHVSERFGALTHRFSTY